MKTKGIYYFVLTSLLLAMLVSCSKKQEAIHQLENFTEDVEENGGNWSADEWQEKAKVFSTLRAEMYKYDYDDKERKEIGRLEGRCAAAFANHVSNGLLEHVKNIGDEIGGALDGIVDGIDNSSHENEDN